MDANRSGLGVRSLAQKDGPPVPRRFNTPPPVLTHATPAHGVHKPRAPVPDKLRMPSFASTAARRTPWLRGDSRPSAAPVTPPGRGATGPYDKTPPTPGPSHAAPSAATDGATGLNRRPLTALDTGRVTPRRIVDPVARRRRIGLLALMLALLAASVVIRLVSPAPATTTPTVPPPAWTALPTVTLPRLPTRSATPVDPTAPLASAAFDAQVMQGFDGRSFRVVARQDAACAAPTGLAGVDRLVSDDCVQAYRIRATTVTGRRAGTDLFVVRLRTSEQAGAARETIARGGTSTVTGRSPAGLRVRAPRGFEAVFAALDAGGTASGSGVALVVDASVAADTLLLARYALAPSSTPSAAASDRLPAATPSAATTPTDAASALALRVEFAAAQARALEPTGS